MLQPASQPTRQTDRHNNRKSKHDEADKHFEIFVINSFETQHLSL